METTHLLQIITSGLDIGNLGLVFTVPKGRYGLEKSKYWNRLESIGEVITEI